jgi:cytochrome P450
MTFSFGSHSCLGYKFTIAEAKVFLATIMPQFVFTPAEGVKITKFNNILTRPYIKDQLELGPRLPVVVGRYVR